MTITTGALSLRSGYTTNVLMAVPSPSLVNDFRLQVAARTVDLSPNARGALLEIPGVLSLGQAYGLDSERAEDHYEVIDSVNTVRGRHQFGFGASLHYVRLDADLANRFAGIFLFPTLDDFASGLFGGRIVQE